MGVDTAAMDRLPWLADEPPRVSAKRRRGRPVFAFALAALVILAIAAFWLGVGIVRQDAPPSPKHAASTMTVQLPPPHAAKSPEVRIPTAGEVQPAPAPVVRLVTSKDVRIAAPPHPRAASRAPAKPRRSGETAVAESSQMQAAASALAAETRPKPAAPAPGFVIPKPWNPRIFAGAAGRVVQIGAFGSVRQAKRGWWFMVQAYPAMAHLPAVVRPTRNSKHRAFFRFQVGTTSQAHSEVLCQRMRKIYLSCAVVGLPWKAKVER